MFLQSFKREIRDKLRKYQVQNSQICSFDAKWLISEVPKSLLINHDFIKTVPKNVFFAIFPSLGLKLYNDRPNKRYWAWSYNGVVNYSPNNITNITLQVPIVIQHFDETYVGITSYISLLNGRKHGPSINSRIADHYGTRLITITYFYHDLIDGPIYEILDNNQEIAIIAKEWYNKGMKITKEEYSTLLFSILDKSNILIPPLCNMVLSYLY